MGRHTRQPSCSVTSGSRAPSRQDSRIFSPAVSRTGYLQLGTHSRGLDLGQKSFPARHVEPENPAYNEFEKNSRAGSILNARIEHNRQLRSQRSRTNRSDSVQAVDAPVMPNGWYASHGFPELERKNR